MPVNGKYGDSKPQVNQDNWKSIGDLARALAEKAARDG